MTMLRHPVYLVDVEGYRPPQDLTMDIDHARNTMVTHQLYDPDTIDFCYKVVKKSGLGPDITFLPKNLNSRHTVNMEQNLDLAEQECKQCIFGAVDNLLERTGLKPADIDILVTTCSIYCPTPSMASMLVNRYKLRTDIQSYHLGGMGCANGVVAVGLLKDLLQARPNVNALFVTTETTTPAFYSGTERNRLVANLIFRMGASAMLISNKKSWGNKIKYELLHQERVHIGAVDDAYRAIWYGPDQEGKQGVYLGKNVVNEASQGLTKAMTKIAPRIMTWRQVAEYLVHCYRQKMGQTQEAYVPNFMEGLQHILIHAGGAKVLDGIGKALRLSEEYLQPSRAVLRDYGNVSSSTTWYSLAWVESHRGVKKGDKIMQVGVGSGVKCGVNVWQAKRDIHDIHKVWEHSLDPEEVKRVKARASIDHYYGAARLAHRLVFLALLLMFLLVVHMVMSGDWPNVSSSWVSKLVRVDEL